MSASPLVVVGEGPLARALARRLSRDGPAVLASRACPDEAGTWLWRYADPSTGEGIRRAVEGARGVILVQDGTTHDHGLFLVLRTWDEPPAGVVVAPSGASWPPGLSDLPAWSRVRTGWCWGGGDPLADAWTEALRSGHALWVADPGTVPVVEMHEAVDVVLAAFEHPGVEWALPGRERRLPELARELAGERAPSIRRAPLFWCARRAGVPTTHVRRWLGRPGGPRATPGWDG